MNIVKAFSKAFEQKDSRGWDKIYVLVDVHGTIMQGVHQKNELHLWYTWALPVLKTLSDMDGVCLIMWTGSHESSIQATLSELAKRGIRFDYVNENPEAEDNEFYCGAGKIYFNVGIDDRFGFEPESDWLELYKYLLTIKSDKTEKSN